ncbi:MAG: class I SAM-dependent methyltransferase [Desulfarculus sp.]|nr:MAG: class I SAM-dependent methyltransferase [Desulfarculus sp.]
MQVSHKLKNKLLRLNAVPLLGKVLYFKEDKPLPDPEFWRETVYQGQQGRLTLRLLGLPLLRLHHSTSLEDVYAQRRNPHLERSLPEMIEKRLIPPLDGRSRVLESGCNAGGFLRYLADCYGCEIHGLDISAEAIEYARSTMFADYPRATFYCQDVLEHQFFNRFPADYFSHTFCLSHLVHVPNGPAKQAYIKQLKRISRCVIFFERMPREDNPEKETRHTEDYAAEYNFTLYRKHPKMDRSKWMGIFYWTPEMNSM